MIGNIGSSILSATNATLSSVENSAKHVGNAFTVGTGAIKNSLSGQHTAVKAAAYTALAVTLIILPVVGFGMALYFMSRANAKTETAPIINPPNNPAEPAKGSRPEPGVTYTHLVQGEVPDTVVSDIVQGRPVDDSSSPSEKPAAHKADSLLQHPHKVGDKIKGIINQIFHR